jgi:hypothetical protein
MRSGLVAGVPEEHPERTGTGEVPVVAAASG